MQTKQAQPNKVNSVKQINSNKQSKLKQTNKQPKRLPKSYPSWLSRAVFGRTYQALPRSSQVTTLHEKKAPGLGRQPLQFSSSAKNRPALNKLKHTKQIQSKLKKKNKASSSKQCKLEANSHKRSKLKQRKQPQANKASSNKQSKLNQTK